MSFKLRLRSIIYSRVRFKPLFHILIKYSEFYDFKFCDLKVVAPSNLGALSEWFVVESG